MASNTPSRDVRGSVTTPKRRTVDEYLVSQQNALAVAVVESTREAVARSKSTEEFEAETMAAINASRCDAAQCVDPSNASRKK